MMDEQRVRLVLAGGGARGAYEVGALSVLLPALVVAGQRPSVLVGTSVGTINITYLAAAPRGAVAGVAAFPTPGHPPPSYIAVGAGGGRAA